MSVTLTVDNNIDWICDIPKTELHVHLEGATSPETYLELAAKNDVALPFTTPEDGYNYFSYVSFTHFLEVYSTCVKAIRDPNDFFILIDRFAEYQAKQNIKYSEFFISMHLHVLNGLDPVKVLANVSMACRKAESDHGVQLRCIPDLSRDREIGVALDSLKAIIRSRNEYIIGLGLGGSERNDTKSFSGLFTTARQAGLRLVCHAGEWRETQVIWDSINSLRAERIGHGITAVKDPQLMDFLKMTQVPIEVCPTSNYCTGLVKKNEDHPIFEMINYGLNITINSDDPTMFNTTLTKELQILIEGGLSKEDILDLLRRNINASFMNPIEKKNQFYLLNTFIRKMK